MIFEIARRVFDTSCYQPSCLCVKRPTGRSVSLTYEYSKKRADRKQNAKESRKTKEDEEAIITEALKEVSNQVSNQVSNEDKEKENEEENETKEAKEAADGEINKCCDNFVFVIL